MDTTLLAAGLVAAGATWLVARMAHWAWPGREGLTDDVLTAGVIGLVAARVGFLAIEDPQSLTRVGNFLIFRSGLSFWTGVAAALGWTTWTYRSRLAVGVRDTALVAPALVCAWSVFQATCPIRGGCPGPASEIGLRPSGYLSPVLPLGILMGVAGFALAWGCGRMARRVPLGEQPGSARARSRWIHLSSPVALVALGGVAAIGAIGSIWLPKIDSVSRQQYVSIGVVVACAATMLLLRLRAGQEAAPA